MILLAIALVLTSLLGHRAWRNRRAEARERKLLKATARTWGVPTDVTDLDELRRLIYEARRAEASSDPIETAARALRRQGKSRSSS